MRGAARHDHGAPTSAGYRRDRESETPMAVPQVVDIATAKKAGWLSLTKPVRAYLSVNVGDEVAPANHKYSTIKSEVTVAATGKDVTKSRLTMGYLGEDGKIAWDERKARDLKSSFYAADFRTQAEGYAPGQTPVIKDGREDRRCNVALTKLGARLKDAE